MSSNTYRPDVLQVNFVCSFCFKLGTESKSTTATFSIPFASFTRKVLSASLPAMHIRSTKHMFVKCPRVVKLGGTHYKIPRREKQLTNVSAQLTPTSTIISLPSAVLSDAPNFSTISSSRKDSIIIVMGILAAITAFCIAVLMCLCVYSAANLFLAKRRNLETPNSGGEVLPTLSRVLSPDPITDITASQQCQCRLSLSACQETRGQRNLDPLQSVIDSCHSHGTKS
jgi:hypothetical protein